MSKQPIGVFDSGVGGTSIWKEIRQLLPNENTIYLADSKYAPYGSKSPEDILDLSIKNTDLLIKSDCKLIVVACNTATTNAISYLRHHYHIPFIGIEPAIKPAALRTKTKAVGILATRGTLSSALFHKTSNIYSSDITIIEQIGEGIVPLIESGKIYSETMKQLLKTYVKPMLEANVDHLVLGCTHYPYLIPVLKEILPEHIKIIDSGAAVAKQTKNVLIQHNLLNENKHLKGTSVFYTNTSTSVIASLLDPTCIVEYLDY